jgi:hypothetical protein
VLTVSPLQEGRLRLGEVVAFCHPETGKLVVHRILKKNSQGFLLQGDNCPAADGLIPAARIVGRVTAVGENRRLVRLGQGPGRFFLALLSRFHLLQPLLYRIRQALSPFLQRVKDKA